MFKSPWQRLLEVGAIEGMEYGLCVGYEVPQPTSSHSKLSLEFQVPFSLRLQALSRSHLHGLLII